MATIQVEQQFKGSINNNVSFEKEEVMMTTAAIVEAIEQRWPITCSKDTIESIKGYVEANESLHPSFSYKQFERENIKRIKVTPEPKDVWLSYERSDYVKEMGTPLPVALTTSLTRDQEAVPNLSDLMLEQSIKQRELDKKRTEQYKDMTEEDALKLVSENGTALLYLPTKFMMKMRSAMQVLLREIMIDWLVKPLQRILIILNILEVHLEMIQIYTKWR